MTGNDVGNTDRSHLAASCDITSTISSNIPRTDGALNAGIRSRSIRENLVGMRMNRRMSGESYARARCQFSSSGEALIEQVSTVQVHHRVL